MTFFVNMKMAEDDKKKSQHQVEIVGTFLLVSQAIICR